jgi:U3 small nucleolar RNA-associated protein 21
METDNDEPFNDAAVLEIQAVSSSSSSDNSSDKSSAAPAAIDDESDGDGDNKRLEDNKDSALLSQPTSTSPNRTITTSTTTATPVRRSCGESRLFVPYRTVGLVHSSSGNSNNNGGGFFLMPHQNSAQATVVSPILTRFQMFRTDRLQPVLVSQPVARHQHPNRDDNKDEQVIQHVVSDSSLSITVAAHGNHHVTLFQRTRPVATWKTPSKQWNIQQLVVMGRMPIPVNNDLEKKGRNEIVAVIAVILAKTIRLKRKLTEDSKQRKSEASMVPIVGDDDDATASDKSASSSSSSPTVDSDDDDHDHGGNTQQGMAQIVILLAGRTTLTVRKRISFSNLPNFVPNTAMHPSTYLNKIVMGGYQIKTDSDGGGHENVVATRQPAACLVNIRSGQVVHVFRCLSKQENEMITSIEQSPALDTVAVGTNRGNVSLVNLKHDKVLFTLKHKNRDDRTHNGAVAITSISFRTDGSAVSYGVAPMAVGRSDGNITVWDLSPPEDDSTVGRKILCEMHRVHPGGVAKLQYFPQEPLLLSCGTTSNSLLMHVFDNPDHSARLLRQRKGHTAPPNKIRYLHAGAGAGGGIMANASDGTDASACQILSSGGPDRTLRIFSTARSVLDKEFSQGQGLEKKARKLGMDSAAELLLPPLTGMAFSEARSRDWGDLVTIHQSHSFSYVWSTKRGAQSGPVLRQNNWNVSSMKKSPPSETHATSVAMSACGSFAVVGTCGGTIYRYNVQSGMPRGSYPRDAALANNGRNKKKASVVGNVHRTAMNIEKNLKTNTRASNIDQKNHDQREESKRKKALKIKLKSASHLGNSVTGLAVDAVNKTLMSVGSDAKLILWNFQTGAPHKKSPFMLPCPATKMCHIRDSDLAAIALDDFSVILFDCSALSVVRRFGKGLAFHTAAISDLGFSPDGRNLYTASLDCTIRVWDVPTNTCIDWLEFDTPPTSLTVSPTGEYLATTHAGKLGISIWSDKTFYRNVCMDGVVLTNPFLLDDAAPITESATDNADQSVTMDSIEKNEDDTRDEQESAQITPKDDGLITLSGLPATHWKNLFHLELVKQRNRPKEPPKKPPSAPFFLQWRGGESLSEEKKANDVLSGKDDEWQAVWSDGDIDESGSVESSTESNILLASSGVEEPRSPLHKKRRKVTHHRSHLASLLQDCSKDEDGDTPYHAVTDYVASLGPSAIDIAFSTLCNGMHDLEDGLPLLLLTCKWLLEACQSRERFEAVNAYLHRFLGVHTLIITGIEENLDRERNKDTANLSAEDIKLRWELIESVSRLREAQKRATEALAGKMEHSLCLLRHLSRMV